MDHHNELEKLILKYPEANWDWATLSGNPAVSVAFMDAHPELPWVETHHVGFDIIDIFVSSFAVVVMKGKKNRMPLADQESLDKEYLKDMAEILDIAAAYDDNGECVRENDSENDSENPNELPQNINPSVIESYYPSLYKFTQKCGSDHEVSIYSSFFANAKTLDAETVSKYLTFFRQKFPIRDEEDRGLRPLYYDRVLDFMTKRFPIDWIGLSRNPNITYDFIKENYDLPWSPGALAFNPNISPDQFDDLVSRYDGLLEYDVKEFVVWLPQITEAYISANFDRINWKWLSCNNLVGIYNHTSE